MIKIVSNNPPYPKIPKKIKVGPYKLKVKIKPDKDMDNKAGLFWTHKMEIWINDTTTTFFRYATFMHEIIEAINYIYDLKLSHNKITTIETALLGLEIIDK